MNYKNTRNFLTGYVYFYASFLYLNLKYPDSCFFHIMCEYSLEIVKNYRYEYERMVTYGK